MVPESLSLVNTASNRCMLMKVNIVSNYCYQNITLNDGFNPVDEKGCSLNNLVVYV